MDKRTKALDWLRACIADIGHVPHSPDEYDNWRQLVRVNGLTPGNAQSIVNQFGKWKAATREAARGPAAKTLADTARAPRLNDYWRLTGDAIIIFDLHVPFHDPAVIERAVLVAKAERVNRLIVGGDFFDFSQFSPFARHAEQPSGDEELATAQDVLSLLLAKFDSIYILRGNHDERFARFTLDEISIDKLYETVSGQVGGRLQVTKFPYCYLYTGEHTDMGHRTFGAYDDRRKWMIVHPSNYSRLRTRSAENLSRKHYCNVLAGHAHHLGVTFDLGSRFVVADGGMATDIEKHPYLMHHASNHPVWCAGFLMLKNGVLTVFDHKGQLTDWSRYERKKKKQA